MGFLHDFTGAFKSVGTLWNKGAKEASKIAKSAEIGVKPIMECNKPINNAYDAITGGAKNALDAKVMSQRLRGGGAKKLRQLKNDVKQGALPASEYNKQVEKMKTVDNWDRAASIFKNSKGEVTAGSAAGGTAVAGLGLYAGVNVPYRVASGGGLYRDSDGNFDVIGMPFL